MSSLINLPNNLIFPPSPLNKPNNVVQVTLPRRQSPSFGSLTLSCSLLVSARRRRRPRTSNAWGSNKEEEEEDPDLEFEVLEYMNSSDQPDLFPNKEDLILAGRFDLVKRIVRQGGWLSYGWDLDDEEEQVGVQDLGIQEHDVNDEFLMDDSRMFQKRFYGGGNGNFEDASSSGRIGDGEDSGIEGILTRLDKERTWSYGYRSKDEESKVSGSCNQDDKELKRRGITYVHGSENSNSVPKSKDRLDDPGGMHTRSDLISGLDVSSNHSKPDTWRNWSNRRAGCSESEFESDEFGEQFIPNDETLANGTKDAGYLGTQLSIGDKIKEYKQIKSFLQNLELELASVLNMLSHKKSDTVVSDKTLKNPSEESHSLYDDWEFRETEIMKARDKLRSLRAQVAVSEGRMALRIIDAQKMVEQKQKKVRYAQRALSLLRTASITWHKSASEVLLVGSFDGWTTQRRMKKSSPGIFSLHLKLYPGRYEIKFIVDGVWTIDPLRPVVNTQGHLNNLLIVS